MNHLGSQAGFSLIEVLTAIGLFSVVAVGLSTSTISNMGLNTRSRTIAAANALAQNKVEQLRLIQPQLYTMPPELTAGTHPPETVTALDGSAGTYTRTYTVSSVPQYYNGSVVGARPGIVEVKVSVSWPAPFAGSVSAVTYACTTPNCG
jgi:prepilin-type N-terminal cleavage/methylation domain-containing protein